MSGLPEALKRELVKLDDLLGTGFIQEEEYQRRKAELYANHGVPYDGGSTPSGGSTVSDPFGGFGGSSDPFGGGYSSGYNSDPFSAPYTTPTPDPFSTPYNSDPFSNPYTTPTPEPTPYNNDPFSTPYTTPDPFSTPYTTPTPDPFSTPYTTPTPYNSDPFSTPYTNVEPYDSDTFTTPSIPPPPPLHTSSGGGSHAVTPAPPPPEPYTRYTEPAPPIHTVPTPPVTPVPPPPEPYTRYTQPEPPMYNPTLTPMPTSYNNNYGDYHGYDPSPSYPQHNHNNKADLPPPVDADAPMPSVKDDPETAKVYMAEWQKKREPFLAVWKEWKDTRALAEAKQSSDPTVVRLADEYANFDASTHIIVYYKDSGRGVFQTLPLPKGTTLSSIGDRFEISQPILVSTKSGGPTFTEIGDVPPPGRYVLKQRQKTPHRTRFLAITGNVLRWDPPPFGHRIEYTTPCGYYSYSAAEGEIAENQIMAYQTGHYEHGYMGTERPTRGFSEYGGYSSYGSPSVDPSECKPSLNLRDFRGGNSKLEAVLKARLAFDKETVGNKMWDSLNATSRFKKWHQRALELKGETQSKQQWQEFEKKREAVERAWRRPMGPPKEAEGDPWTVKQEDPWSTHRKVDACVLTNWGEKEEGEGEEGTKNESERGSGMDELQGKEKLLAAFPWAEPVWFTADDDINKHNALGPSFRYLNPQQADESQPVFARKRGRPKKMILDLAAELMPQATYIEDTRPLPPPPSEEEDSSSSGLFNEPTYYEEDYNSSWSEY